MLVLQRKSHPSVVIMPHWLSDVSSEKLERWLRNEYPNDSSLTVYRMPRTTILYFAFDHSVHPSQEAVGRYEESLKKRLDSSSIVRSVQKCMSAHLHNDLVAIPQWLAVGAGECAAACDGR